MSHTRESLAIDVAGSIRSGRLIEVLTKLVSEQRGSSSLKLVVSNSGRVQIEEIINQPERGRSPAMNGPKKAGRSQACSPSPALGYFRQISAFLRAWCGSTGPSAGVPL
jgi:hypothetical protein